MARETHTNVKINRQTTLDVLYVYPPGTVVEYPETKANGRIGHLFEMDPDVLSWQNPANSFAYSSGEPKGSRVGSRSGGGGKLTCAPLCDAEGSLVSVRESHATCMNCNFISNNTILTEMRLGQGCKACSWSDQAAMSIPHESATQEHVQSRLLSENLCSSTQLLQKTRSFWAALLKTGCRAPNHSEESGSVLSIEKQLWKEKWDEQCHALHRGKAVRDTCQGQLYLDHDHEGRAFIQYVICIVE